MPQPETPLWLFADQLGQIADIGGGGIGRLGEPCHQEEDRRLGAAEVVASVAIGDVSEGFDLISKIIHHVLDHLGTTGNL